jgi:zinc transport system substrate-binding protein
LEAITGDKFSVNTAIPSGSNPEIYDPSPAQMVDIGKSPIYFSIGALDIDKTWLRNILMNNKGMKLVNCSAGLEPMPGNGHHSSDPHVWSSPGTALVICKNMLNAIVAYDPKNRDYYIKNFKRLEASIIHTDSIIHSYVDTAQSKAFVIYHPALSYFARQYSLTQYSIEANAKSPTPAQLAKLVRQAKKDKAGVIFLQEEYDEKNAETISKELNAGIVPINLLSYRWNEELIKIAKAIARNDDAKNP